MNANWLFFNPLVNRLNRKLKIRHKQYLAFLCTYLFVFFFAIYQYGNYEMIHLREKKIHHLHQFQNGLQTIRHEVSKEELWLAQLQEKHYSTEYEQVFVDKQSYFKVLIDSVYNIQNKIKELRSYNRENIGNYLEKHLRVDYPEKMNFLFGLLKQLEYYQTFPVKTEGNACDSIQKAIKATALLHIDFLDMIDERIYTYLIAANKHYEIILTKQASLYKTEFIRIAVFLIISMLVWYIVSTYVIVRITKPIELINKYVRTLGKGNYSLEKDNIFSCDKDEINDIHVGVKKISRLLKNTILFAKQIGNNKFEDIKEYLAEGELTIAMKDMRDKLQKISQENEEQKKIEHLRNWNMEGIAQVGDLLRKQYKNMSNLYYDLSQFLVTYLKANQGAIYILNTSNDENNTKFLEMKAAFAYDRKKAVDRSFKLGESMIGQCAIEKEYIYISEIPDDYIEIGSGLGHAKPNYLYIAPIKMENEVFGVFEMASFKEFTQYDQDFIEQALNTIAASISNMQMSLQTNELLRQTKEQAEMLQSSEEEMRQNIEELQATQEETKRREEELVRNFEALQLKEYKTKELLETTEHRELLLKREISNLEEQIQKLRS